MRRNVKLSTLSGEGKTMTPPGSFDEMANSQKVLRNHSPFEVLRSVDWQ